MRKALCLDDFRELASSRLPRVAFDFIDGFSGEGRAGARNREALKGASLMPRVLRNCEARSTSISLLGKQYRVPFGIAPIGLANLAWPGTDLSFARHAAHAAIPAILSTASTTTIEAAAAVADGNLWFQLYVGRDHPIVVDLIERAEAAGIQTLVVTLDVPAPGKRLRDLRNGFTLPLRPSLGLLLDLACHPRWAAATLRHGAPRFANLERYHRSTTAASLAQFMASQSSARLDVSVLDAIRRRWQGPLLVKGVLHPLDARLALSIGCNGVIVSNHGGRQLDTAVTPLDVLPAIRAEVGPAVPLLMDGGIRSGEDILIAIAAGADFAFLGRPFVFSVAARGIEHGPAEVTALLSDELDRGLAQLGFASIDALREGRKDVLFSSTAHV
jgi:(S)-mandelate dehydrogenase